MRTRLVGVALVAMIVASACGGGGGRLSTRDYVRATSAVCERANRAVSRIDVSRRRDRAAVRILSIHREAVDDLRELRPPKEFEPTARLWIALVDQSLGELDSMRDALRHRAITEAKQYAANAVALSERARTVARRYGITTCAVPDMTV